jgi:extracellular elastinolytic metalloproteinase
MHFKFYIACITASLLLCSTTIKTEAQTLKGNLNEVKANRELLEKNASLLGISKADIGESVITDMYTDNSSGITYLYVQQAYQGIRVYNQIISATIRNGAVLSHQGAFIPDLKARIKTVIPAKTHIDAVRESAKHLQLNDQARFTSVADDFLSSKSFKVSNGGIAKKDIETTLMFVPDYEQKSVKLAWNVSIDVAGSSDWWNVRIDAVTGEFLEKNNLTVYESNNELHENITSVEAGAQQKKQLFYWGAGLLKPEDQTMAPAPPNVTSATYRVIPFPVESPLHGAFANRNNPWELAGLTNNATTHGWHFDGINNYAITRGNNVFAFLDRDNNNTPNATNNWPDTSTTPAPNLSFIHTFETNVQPNQSIETKKVVLDNLFYWNNIIHDITYQYGFTEVAGNFQTDNLGRGGFGNDQVMANAQDNSGFNNANFSTPADGSSGRMQMYLYNTQPFFTITSPVTISNIPSRENSFTAPNKLADVGSVSGQVVLYDMDPAYNTGCAASRDASRLAGKIALIDATVCNFIVKVKNAQNAGAIGALLYYPSLLGMTGTDATVTIPCVSITTATANTIVSYNNANTPVSITLEAGMRRDGDLDNGIITHEYGHGVSTRLTGGPANSGCLNNAEQGGEGWSDYLSLMLTTDWANTAVNAGANPRGIGNYVMELPTTGLGIRRYQYSTDMSVNPLTYSDVASNTAVHAIGEVWCSALWDMTWNIIQQTNSIEANIYNAASTKGNVVALNLVMTGMKLQTCGPGFLDARDAILVADSILYNNAHRCAIWNAFARRGMGFSARQGYSTSATDQTAAFDLPTNLRVAYSGTMQLPESSQRSISHQLTCDCSPLTNMVIRDTLPAGYTFVSSSPAGATVNGNVVSFPASSFAASETKTFSITVQTPSISCLVSTPVNDNRDANTTGSLVSAGTTGWVSSTMYSHSPVTSWFSRTPATSTANTLTSPVLTPAAGTSLSILSFWHYYNTEIYYDGGVVEYSINGGSTWLDASPLMILGKYPAIIMNSGTALAGRRAFSGTNYTFNPVMIDFSSLGSTPVQIRFRTVSDSEVGMDGWYVDDIVKTDGCGSILKTGVYTGAGVLIDTMSMPVFLTAGGVLPVTWLDFTAQLTNRQTALQWKVTNEVNVSHYEVEHAADGINFTKLFNVEVNPSTNPNKTYNQIHPSPVAGNNYYRIKQIDYDGRSSYSRTRLVRSEAAMAISISPNPAQSTVRIQSAAAMKNIQVFNTAGQMVLTANPFASNYNLNVATLPTGTYSVRIETNNEIVTQKLIKQ